MMSWMPHELLLLAAFILLLATLTLALYKIIKGPGVHERIIALDLTAIITMALILVYGLLQDDALYMDAVIVIALITFVGTVALSGYLKQRHHV